MQSNIHRHFMDRFSWFQIKRERCLCSKHSLPSGITAGSKVAFVPLHHISLPLFFSQLCGVVLGFLCRRCVLLQERRGARYTGDANMTQTDMCLLLWSANGTSLIHLCLSCLKSFRVSSSDTTGRSSQTTRECENVLS